MPCFGKSDALLFCLLIFLAVSSWFLVIQYRGASDFTDTLGYMAQAKYLVGERQFNPARISWEHFARGEVNSNATMSYPGQLFSLGIGMVSKILDRPLDMWMLIAFNFFVYVFCSIFCLLLLARYLRGWEFFLIGFFSLTNYFVMCACASTITDGLGYAFLLFALWLASLNTKRSFIIGLVFGMSFFVRAHLAIFALFVPLLLFDKINKHAIRGTCLFVLGIACAYGGVFGLLKLYVTPQPPPLVVVHAVESDNPGSAEGSSENKSFSTFGWYTRQISESLPTLKQYGIGWLTLGAYKTLGPASWCFGPLFFFVVISLLFRWSHPPIASGYWKTLDPTNGYFAIRAELIPRLAKKRISPRYFFESSLLIELGILRAVVRDVPMRTIYGEEQSHLSVKKALLEFPPKLFAGFLRRVFYNKFLFDTSPDFLLGCVGLLLLLGGITWGVVKYIQFAALGIPATAGTVMFSALPSILGFQMCLTALQMDFLSVPSVPLTHPIVR